MKGLSKGRYDETFAGEDVLLTMFVLMKSINHTKQTQKYKCLGYICFS